MQFNNYIILDDEPISCLLNEMVVRHSGREASHLTFNDPQDCLTYLEALQPPALQPTCLLLDINMPKLSGWQFLEKFDAFPNFIKDMFTIVIVTSSNDDEDLVRVQNHSSVAGYLSKPVSAERFRQLLDHLDLKASA